MVARSERGVKRACAFCDPKTTQYEHFAKFGRQRLDLAHLLETDNVFLKPDILPSSPDGHFLVIPKPHSVSFASLPNLAGEVGSIIYQAEQVIQRPLVFFEHGSIAEGSNVRSVYHQHGHLIPDGNINMLDYMRNVLDRMGIPHTIIDTPDTSPVVNLQRYAKNSNYLYIQQGRTGLIAYDSVDGQPTDRFPSQIAQKSVSLLLWNRSLNWKEISGDPELERLSVGAIAHIVDECRFPIVSQSPVLGG